MPGLGGFITGVVAFVVTLVVLVLVGLYCLFAKDPNLGLLYAALAAFATMGVFMAVTYMDDKGWLDFRNSLYDIMGPTFVLTAILAAISVYALT